MLDCQKIFKFFLEKSWKDRGSFHSKDITGRSQVGGTVFGRKNSAKLRRFPRDTQLQITKIELRLRIEREL
jgi:hypothetical protein